MGPFPDLLSCSAHGNYFFPQYQCAQYNDHCLKTIVKHWDVPLQHEYLNEVIASGHGGFVHSCFLGAYWNSPPYPCVVTAAPCPQSSTLIPLFTKIRSWLQESSARRIASLTRWHRKQNHNVVEPDSHQRYLNARCCPRLVERQRYNEDGAQGLYVEWE